MGRSCPKVSNTVHYDDHGAQSDDTVTVSDEDEQKSLGEEKIAKRNTTAKEENIGRSITEEEKETRSSPTIDSRNKETSEICVKEAKSSCIMKGDIESYQDQQETTTSDNRREKMRERDEIIQDEKIVENKIGEFSATSTDLTAEGVERSMNEINDYGVGETSKSKRNTDAVIEDKSVTTSFL